MTLEKTEFLDHQELLDHQDLPETVDPLDLLVQEDSKACLDLLVKMEWQEKMVQLVFKVHPE